MGDKVVKENPELPQSARLEQWGRQGGQTGGQHPWQAGRGSSGTRHREITDTAQGDHGHGTGGSKTQHREITDTAQGDHGHGTGVCRHDARRTQKPSHYPLISALPAPAINTHAIGCC